MVEVIKKNILLNSFDIVKEFVNKANTVDGDVTVYSGRYVVNGKSLMGIFSIDSHLPITVEYPANAPSGFIDFMNLIGV